MSEISSGICHIVSFARGNEPASVSSLNPPPIQVVRLGEDKRLWNVQKDDIGPHVYRFAIEGLYPFTGLSENKQTVVALDKIDNSVYWYVTPVEDAPLPNTFTIAWDGEHDKVWTVSDESGPNPEIVLKNIGLGPPQWFRFTRA